MKTKVVAIILAFLCLITFTCCGGCGEKNVAGNTLAENTTQSQQTDLSESGNADGSDDKTQDSDDNSDESNSDISAGNDEEENAEQEKESGIESCLLFELTDSGDEYFVKGIVDGEYEIVEIPDIYEGLPVTEIKAYAFSGTKIKRATIPMSVVKIGERAFDGTNVEEVEFAIKDGWSANDKSVPSSVLENKTYAAIYLKNTFSRYEWKRIDNENGGNGK